MRFIDCGTGSCVIACMPDALAPRQNLSVCGWSPSSQLVVRYGLSVDEEVFVSFSAGGQLQGRVALSVPGGMSVVNVCWEPGGGRALLQPLPSGAGHVILWLWDLCSPSAQRISAPPGLYGPIAWPTAAWSPTADVLAFWQASPRPSLVLYDLSHQVWLSLRGRHQRPTMAWGHCGLLQLGSAVNAAGVPRVHVRLLQIHSSQGVPHAVVPTAVPGSEQHRCFSFELAPDGRHAVLLLGREASQFRRSVGFSDGRRVHRALYMLDCCTGERGGVLPLHFVPNHIRWSIDGSKVLVVESNAGKAYSAECDFVLLDFA